MDLGLKGKVAVVFAASKGLGKAAVASLLMEGCKVAASSRNLSNLENLKKDLSNFSDNIFCLNCDVSDETQIKYFIDKAIDKYGKIEIVVNNCGGPPALKFDSVTDDLWLKYFYEIFLSVVRITRAVTEIMKRNNYGRIINITSIAVKQPIENLIISNALRNSVVGYAKTISKELASYNITVNNIAPGLIFTDRIKELVKVKEQQTGQTYNDLINDLRKNIPAGKLGNPEDIGNLIAFLSSDKASYITGQTIVVDGGMVKSTY